MCICIKDRHLNGFITLSPTKAHSLSLRFRKPHELNVPLPFRISLRRLRKKITKFQITFTDQEQVIVAESSGALTAEAANLIDANSIGTDSWDFLTFINV